MFTMTTRSWRGILTLFDVMKGGRPIQKQHVVTGQMCKNFKGSRMLEAHRVTRLDLAQRDSNPNRVGVEPQLRVTKCAKLAVSTEEKPTWQFSQIILFFFCILSTPVRKVLGIVGMPRMWIDNEARPRWNPLPSMRSAVPGLNFGDHSDS